MRQKFAGILPLIAVVTVVASTCSLAVAQGVSLQEQLTAQYKLVKMGSDSSGAAVVEEGTLLAIQKGGILAVPWTDKTVLASKYENGAVHGPSGLMVEGKKRLLGHFSQTAAQGQTTHLFSKGDKVYPTKISVSPDKDTVTIGIVACDSCNKTDPTTYNKADVVFVFAKGTLAKASAGDVEDTIGQLLAISNDDQQDQGGNQGGDQQNGGGQDQGGNQGGGQQGGGQGGGQQQQQAEPQTIQLGQSVDDVTAALGKPEKIVNLGAKQIYIYKDMKITFLKGKVSDVQ